MYTLRRLVPYDIAAVFIIFILYKPGLWNVYLMYVELILILPFNQLSFKEVRVVSLSLKIVETSEEFILTIADENVQQNLTNIDKTSRNIVFIWNLDKNSHVLDGHKFD